MFGANVCRRAARRLLHIAEMRTTAITTAMLLTVIVIPIPAQEKPGRRIEPVAPFGQGGALIISVDPALCDQDDLLLRLMREDVEATTRWNVFEARVAKPCTWTISDLWPGNYDVSVRRESMRQVLADRAFEITVGTIAVETLDSSAIEVAGLVTIDGARAVDLQELRLVFRLPNQPNAHTEIPIDERGEYRGHLNFDGDVQLFVGGERGLIANLKSLKVERGFNRYDIDFPPGLIKVTIVPPPQLTSDFRILCAIEREAPRSNPRERPTLSKTFRQILMDATRTYVIIGQGYGRYVIRAGTDAGNPSDSKPLVEIVVNLTPEEPRQDVVLDVSKAPLTATPMRPLNIEGCPAPRTAACVHGPTPP